LDGLPLNLEALLRKAQTRFGTTLNPLETLDLPLYLHRLLDQNEDYWERDAGSRPPRTDRRYENLGIYGWDVRDALSSTSARARARVTATKPTDDFLGIKPEHDNDIAAWSVLAPFGDAAAMLDAAASHGRDGGIGTLVVVLGANNALRTVTDKKVVWSAAGFNDLDRKDPFTVWRPSHFAVEYSVLVRVLRRIPAARVVLSTVPHVTVAPIAFGVNPQNPGQKWRPASRYFPYYTDPWIAEADFDPTKDRHLTHQQARAVDSAIDQFNDTITAAVSAARREGRNWRVLDLCGVLDGLAYRRFAADEAAAAANAWKPFVLPGPIADLDARFFRSGPAGRSQGGLFGLDAVHPTTSGYGIVAQAVLGVLAGAGVAVTPVDFAALRRKDTLNSSPPALLDKVLGLISPFMTRLVSR
jgi:lysophospholipase L1-like esterase